MDTTSLRPARTLVVSVAYLIALGAGAWILSMVVGQPIAGADADGWLAIAMIVAAVAGWLVVLVRLPNPVSAAARLVLPAAGAGGAFLLAAVVLHGLGSGDPLKGPTLALAQFGHPTLYLAVALALLATLVASMGTPPHREERDRPIV